MTQQRSREDKSKDGEGPSRKDILPEDKYLLLGILGSLSMCEAFYLNNTVAVTRYGTVDIEDVILGVHPPYLPEKRP